MSTSTRQAGAVKPVSGKCRWVRRPSLHAPGVLSINAVPYAVAIVAAPGGKIAGWRLVNSENGKLYDIPADLSRCECRDFEYRRRPGGCKHIRALRASLRRTPGKPPEPIEPTEAEAKDAAKQKSLLRVLTEQGWCKGAPEHISLDTIAQDGHTAARLICKECRRKGHTFHPFRRDGTYKGVAQCRCGACVEL